MLHQEYAHVVRLDLIDSCVNLTTTQQSHSDSFIVKHWFVCRSTWHHLFPSHRVHVKPERHVVNVCRLPNVIAIHSIVVVVVTFYLKPLTQTCWCPIKMSPIATVRIKDTLTCLGETQRDLKILSDPTPLFVFVSDISLSEDFRRHTGGFGLTAVSRSVFWTLLPSLGGGGWCCLSLDS